MNVTCPQPDLNRYPGLTQVLDCLPGARLVGGCVRDWLAGQSVSDIDLATPDPPDQVAQALARAGLRAIPTGMAHGTVTALAGGGSFEITTLRRDVATDGRHAVVAFTDDWLEDAARRDFTINAMSMDRAGKVFDYFGGQADLAAGVVRFVGDAASRITEDYLRILRYFRFFARYNPAAPDADAVTAIAAHAEGLARLSVERVWSELKRILQAQAPDCALALMAELGVLDRLLPGGRLAPVDDLPVDPLLRLSALWPSGPAPLNLSSAEADRLALLQQDAPADAASDDDLRRALADTAPDILIGRAWRQRRGEALRDRIAALPVPVFPLAGRDLMAQGLKPGPDLGRALARLRQTWLNSGCRLDRAALLDVLNTHFPSDVPKV